MCWVCVLENKQIFNFKAVGAYFWMLRHAACLFWHIYWRTHHRRVRDAGYAAGSPVQDQRMHSHGGGATGRRIHKAPEGVWPSQQWICSKVMTFKC